MPFTGKAKHPLKQLPYNAEDVSDIIGIVAPYETPLLCHLGDPMDTASDNLPSKWFSSKIEINPDSYDPGPVSLLDEIDYQKQERLRESLRDLENTIVNGDGSDFIGLTDIIQTNRFPIKVDNVLTKALLEQAIYEVRKSGIGIIDTIVVNGIQRRRINKFTGLQYKDRISIYESDFGLCRMVLSRWVPTDTVLLLDSSRVDVKPLPGRSFHCVEDEYILGEYALDVTNEKSHAIITDLSTV